MEYPLSQIQAVIVSYNKKRKQQLKDIELANQQKEYETPHFICGMTEPVIMYILIPYLIPMDLTGTLYLNYTRVSKGLLYGWWIGSRAEATAIGSVWPVSLPLMLGKILLGSTVGDLKKKYATLLKKIENNYQQQLQNIKNISEEEKKVINTYELFKHMKDDADEGLLQQCVQCTKFQHRDLMLARNMDEYECIDCSLLQDNPI